MISPLHLIMYNCRGWNSGSPYITNLLKLCDVCLIQEHWLIPEKLVDLNIDDEFLAIGISGMDSSRLLPGRPFGGCAILFRKSLLPCVTTLQSNSNRFCAILLTDSINASILLLNVYLPTDYGTSLSELEFVSIC